MPRHHVDRIHFRYGGEIGHRVGHAHEFGLAAIDRVAEFPPADRFEDEVFTGPVMAQADAQEGAAMAAWRDRPCGSSPIVNPAATGYSPLRVWMSVPTGESVR